MEPVDQLEQDEWLSFEEKKSLLQFDLDNFADLFQSIRNDVVHDGNYYEMQIWLETKSVHGFRIVNRMNVYLVLYGKRMNLVW